jgi:hypothetical protein
LYGVDDRHQVRISQVQIALQQGLEELRIRRIRR